MRIADNIKRTGYPDAEAEHHGHGDLTDKITNDNAGPLFFEWVYVIDPIKRVLEVLANRRAEGTHTETGECGGYHEWQQPNYEHYLLATYSLDGNEPNWKELEARADQISDVAYQLFKEEIGEISLGIKEEIEEIYARALKVGEKVGKIEKALPSKKEVKVSLSSSLAPTSSLRIIPSLST